MISSSRQWIVEARCLAVTLAPLQQTMASQSAMGSGSVIAVALADVCFRVQSGKHLLAASISGFVQGFGCRPATAERHTPVPASESRQRTNPRETVRGVCRGLRYGDYMSGGTVKPFLPCFCAFFCSTAPPGFLPPRPQISDAGARRSCQGRPSLCHRGTLRRLQAAP